MTNATEIATEARELTAEDLNRVSGGSVLGTINKIVTARNVAFGVATALPGPTGVVATVGAGFLMGRGSQRGHGITTLRLPRAWRTTSLH